MSIVCRTLVLIDDEETLRVVAQAFPHPKYELEFVESVEEASAHAVSDRMDLFIADSKFADDERVGTIRHGVPTLFIEPEYVKDEPADPEGGDGSEKIRVAAERLLRKNYINWIIDALEYSS